MFGFGKSSVENKYTKLTNKINSNWEKWEAGETEGFQNKEFIEKIIEWRQQHSKKSISGKIKKISKYLHFGEEFVLGFGILKLVKLIEKPDDFNGGALFQKIDFDNELVLWCYWESNTGFLLTNKAMYCAFSGETMTDNRKRIYVKSLDEIKSIKIKMALVHAKVLFNDELMGVWTIGEHKDFIRKVCDSIANRCSELSSTFEPSKATTGGSSDPVEKLKKLKELFDSGVLTGEEYEEKKKTILDDL